MLLLAACDGHLVRFLGADGDRDHEDAVAFGGGDCNDADPSVNPDAADPYGDGIDSNCDGIDGIDDDRDGYASKEGVTAESCPLCDLSGLDCDDDDARINPGAEEIPYDGLDQDCDGLQDDCDVDGDDYAARVDSDADGTYECDPPPGEIDCNDADAAVHEGAQERCGDAKDEDCNGVAERCLPDDPEGDGVDIDSAAIHLIGASQEVLVGANIEVGAVVGGADPDGPGAALLIYGSGLYEGEAPESEKPPGALLVVAGADIADWAGRDEAPGESRELPLVPAELVDPQSDIRAYVRWGRNERQAAGEYSYAADVDGDGWLDLIVGAPGRGDRDGGVFVELGPLEAPEREILDLPEIAGPVGARGRFGAGLGSAYASADDADPKDAWHRGGGDTKIDLVVASPDGWEDGSGAIYVLHGPRETGRAVDVDAYDTAFYAPAAEDGALIGHAAAGDYDGDGVDDLLVSRLLRGGDAFDGQAWLLSGDMGWGEPGTSTSLDDLAVARFEGRDQACLGQAILFADVDNSGGDDIVIGAPCESGTRAVDPYVGALYVFRDFEAACLKGTPTPGMDCPSLRLVGEPAETTDQSNAGRGVRAGDVDADGAADLLVAAGTSPPTVYLLGGARVGSLPDGNERIVDVADFWFVGPETSDSSPVIRLSDLDADGYDDMILADPGWDSESGDDAGRVSIFWGGILPIP